jgi:hypothetical protein
MERVLRCITVRLRKTRCLKEGVCQGIETPIALATHSEDQERITAELVTSRVEETSFCD